MVVLLILLSLFSFGQTKEQVIALLHEIDDESTRFGGQVVFIEEFNFGIHGGRNWLVEWEGRRGQRFPVIYVVDVDTKEIKFDNLIIGVAERGRTNPHSSHLDNLPGHTVGRWAFQIGDFNGKGYEMVLNFNIGAGGPSVDISAFVPQTGRIEMIFSENFDDRYENPPVRFIVYRGMYGFMVREGNPPQVAGGPTWTPDPPSPRAGRWFFYTWDAEQRTFVEVGEVDEAFIEGDWHPGKKPAVKPIQEQNNITAYQLGADTIEETTPTDMTAVHQPIPVTSTAQPLFNGAATSPLLTWMWIVIASGVIGGLVLVVVRRKR
jgi:hypothetical protein